MGVCVWAYKPTPVLNETDATVRRTIGGLLHAAILISTFRTLPHCCCHRHLPPMAKLSLSGEWIVGLGLVWSILLYTYSKVKATTRKPSSTWTSVCPLYHGAKTVTCQGTLKWVCLGHWTRLRRKLTSELAQRSNWFWATSTFCPQQPAEGKRRI